jgi:TetR/AcrR family transcriptional regulator
MATKPTTGAPRPQKKTAATKARGAASTEDGGSKSAILEAALQIFARDGFDGASLPQIARAANVGHPLIHYHFASKDNLWRQTVEYAFGGLLAEASTIEAASRGLSPSDRLRVLIRAFSLFAARYPSHLGLIMSEARVKGERWTWLRTNYTGDFVSRMRRILAAAQAEKQIKDIPINHIDVIILGSIVLYFSLGSTFSQDTNIAEQAEEHANYVIDAIFNGIAL